MQQDRRELARAVAAVARVGRALVGVGGLDGLGHEALAEISGALGLRSAAMYLTDPSQALVLRRFAQARQREAPEAVERFVLGPEEWRFLVASPGPLVFRDPAAGVVQNPFRPPSDAWLVLPLVSGRSIFGVVVGSTSLPLSLDPVAAETLRSIAALITAGVATARLREEVQRTEIQRERMRLAAELHDGLAQDLALAVRELAFLDAAPSEESARASRERLRLAVTEAHRLVRAGLEDLGSGRAVAGLEQAIRELCERFRLRGLRVDVSIDASTPVPPAAVASILRVAHEALTNVQRHAGVEVAAVIVTEGPGELRVFVDDAGPGFDAADVPPPGGGRFGLWLMRERALALGGRLSVIPSPAGGARVALSIPLDRLR